MSCAAQMSAERRHVSAGLRRQVSADAQERDLPGAVSETTVCEYHRARCRASGPRWLLNPARRPSRCAPTRERAVVPPPERNTNKTFRILHGSSSPAQEVSLLRIGADTCLRNPADTCLRSADIWAAHDNDVDPGRRVGRGTTSELHAILCIIACRAGVAPTGLSCCHRQGCGGRG